MGEYVLLRQIGRGGMGAVYQARHPRLNRDVALKVLAAGAHARPTQQERFRLEAQAAARLRHPNIVAIQDVGQAGGYPYLVMDLVEGENLAELVGRTGPLPGADAAEVVRKVALALHYAHDNMILHRDVKPANVLITRTGEPMLTDFGLAKVLDSEDGPTQSGQFLGTPGYMAPEQAAGGLTDARTDVYGLGALLYHLLAGDAPFTGSAIEILARISEEDPEPLEDVDQDLETICFAAMEKDPVARYPTAKALADDLGRFLRQESIEASPPTAVDRARKWARRNRTTARVTMASLALLAIGATGGGAWLLSADDRARRALTAEAREAALAAARELQDGAERNTGSALEAFQAALRWYSSAPADGAEEREAARTLFDAALTLGEVALASEQWDLAAQAFAQAKGLGIDDERASSLVERVETERVAGARERREAVEALLARAESGELGKIPNGLQEVVIGLVRYPEPQTIGILTKRLEGITAELYAAEVEVVMEAEEPDAEEKGIGGQRLEGLPEALAERNGPLQPISDEAQRTLSRATERLMKRKMRRFNHSETSTALSVSSLIANRQRDHVPAGKLELARVCCEALGWIGGRDERAVEALGRYMRVEADEMRAIPAALALCRLGTDRALALIEAARGRHGENSAFAKQVERGLARTPVFQEMEDESALSYFRRGSMRLAQGDSEGALADQNQAIELDPTLDEAWVERALARRDLGDIEGALADVDQVIQRSPRVVPAWINRGNFKRLLGRPQEAKEDLDQALALDRWNSNALLNRGGLLLMELNDPRGALEDFQLAVTLDPNLSLAWTGVGRAQGLLGDHEKAKAAFETALARDPRQAQAWRGLANSHLALKELRSALEGYDRAIDLDPKLVAAVLERGEVRAALGDLQGAIEDYERVLEIDPSHTLARTMLERARSAKAGGPPMAIHPGPASPSPTTGVSAKPVASSGGLVFTAQPGWQQEAPSNTMRVVQYRLPRVAGDARDASLVVFYFQGAGGTPSDNFERWCKQFEQPDGTSTQARAQIERRDQNGRPVHFMDVSGTFLERGARYPGSRMLAAIVEDPKGPHFCKLIGPKATVERWRESFQAFLEQIRPADPR